LWDVSRKTFRPWSPHQAYLIPPSPDEWLPEEHLVHFVLEVVEELDLSAIEVELRSRDARGQKGYDPRMMVALLLYGYCTGVYSSRRIAKATYEDIATRYLTADQHPHFTRIAAFRREHLEALSGLFATTVQLCARAGLVELGHVSVDGTKIQANASKHKAMSYDRMQTEEDKLRAEMEALLARAEAVDQHEDERFGIGRDELELPEELKRRETRRARIRQAKAELEAEAKTSRAERLRKLATDNDERTVHADTAKQRAAAATRAKNQRREADELDPPGDDDDDEPPSTKLPKHRVPAEPDGRPKAKAQRNFTDPDSRIMVDGQGAFTQAYNGQAAVCEPTQVIVACPLSNQAPDVEYLVPVLEDVEQLAGSAPQSITADTGYWSAANARWCEARGIDAHIATGRRRHGVPSPADSERSTPRNKMAAKLRTPDGDARYRRRKATVEPVFGQIKEARHFRRFLLRGLHKVRGEWALICAAHNLLKLFHQGGVPA